MVGGWRCWVACSRISRSGADALTMCIHINPVLKLFRNFYSANLLFVLNHIPLYDMAIWTDIHVPGVMLFMTD